jgi:PKD repeat protein
VNKIVTFNGTALTGTTPITYSWNFGDGSAVGSGSPITHLFPITLTTHSYTVTLTAANACGTAPVLKSLTVQPQTIFLPLVTK